MEEVALRLCDRFDITIVTAKLRRDLLREDTLSPLSVRHGEGGGGGEVKIIRVGLGLPIDKWLYPLLAPLVTWKLKPDVIHAVLESFAGLALLLSKAVGYRAVRILTLQTTNRNFLRGMIIRSPDMVTAISKVLADQAATLGRKDVTVIPNGIPYGEIRKACNGVEKISGRILFVGRLEKMKGVDTLLRAFAQIQNSRPHLHIAGSGSEWGTLEVLSRKLGIADRVQFLGYVTGDALYREYAEAEIFCALSRSEALGNVFLEAQAAGCAVVASDIGGIPEIVKDGVTGILIEDGRADLAADVLTTLLTDEQFRTELAAAAVEHAKAFDWNDIAKRYAQLY